MAILDNIQESEVDVCSTIGSDDSLYCFDATVEDLLSLYKERRVMVSFNCSRGSFKSSCKYVEEVIPDVLLKLSSLGEIVWTSNVYILKNDDETEFVGYVCFELDVRTVYQTARILYSLISVFCRIGDKRVVFFDINRETLRGWSFTTKYADWKYWNASDDDSDEIWILVERILGRPLTLLEQVRCKGKFKKLYERVKG